MKTQHDIDLEEAKCFIADNFCDGDRDNDRALSFTVSSLHDAYLDGLQAERSRKSEASGKGFDEWLVKQPIDHPNDKRDFCVGFGRGYREGAEDAWKASYSSRDGEVEGLKEMAKELVEMGEFYADEQSNWYRLTGEIQQYPIIDISDREKIESTIGDGRGVFIGGKRARQVLAKHKQKIEEMR